MIVEARRRFRSHLCPDKRDWYISCYNLDYMRTVILNSTDRIKDLFEYMMIWDMSVRFPQLLANFEKIRHVPFHLKISSGV